MPRIPERPRAAARLAPGASLALASVLAFAATGCGGGSPLLHPARTLRAGDVRAAAGLSARVAPGSLGEDLRSAREIATQDATGASSPGEPGTNPAYAKGALVAAAIAPGLAPFAGARVGIEHAFEGGLAYTGRGVRADLRRSFDRGDTSLSIGLGLSAALYGRQQGSTLPNVDLGALRGYGADIPVLVGWQSPNDLYSVWLGPRGGVEWLKVEELTTEPRPPPPGAIGLEATRWHAGGVVGLATGFNHLHVAIEAEVGYQAVRGTYNATKVAVSGLSLTPATALWWTF